MNNFLRADFNLVIPAIVSKISKKRNRFYFAEKEKMRKGKDKSQKGKHKVAS